MNFKNIFLLASIGISFSLAASNPKSDEEKYVQYPDDDVWGPPEHNQPQPAPVPSASAGHPRMQRQPADDHDPEAASFAAHLNEHFSLNSKFSVKAMHLGAQHQEALLQRQGYTGHNKDVLTRIQSATQGTIFNTHPLDEYYAEINAQQKSSIHSSPRSSSIALHDAQTNDASKLCDGTSCAEQVTSALPYVTCSVLQNIEKQEAGSENHNPAIDDRNAALFVGQGAFYFSQQVRANTHHKRDAQTLEHIHTNSVWQNVAGAAMMRSTQPLDRYYDNRLTAQVEARNKRQQQVNNITWGLGGMAIAAGAIKLWSLSSGSKPQPKQ